MRPPIRELLDTAPSAELETDVRQVAPTVPGGAALENVLCAKLGSGIMWIFTLW